MSKTASREIQPLSVYLGALGMTGMTALAGLHSVDVKAVKVKHKETVENGIDRAVGGFLSLFRGQNVGKMVVKLA